MSARGCQKQNCAVCAIFSEKSQSIENQSFRFLKLRTFCAVTAMGKFCMYAGQGYRDNATKTAPKRGRLSNC
jgi:hypothetical protein